MFLIGKKCFLEWGRKALFEYFLDAASLVKNAIFVTVRRIVLWF